MLSPVKKPGANPVRTVLEQTLGWLPPESESSYLVNTADRTLSPAGCHPVPGYFTLTYGQRIPYVLLGYPVDG